MRARASVERMAAGGHSVYARFRAPIPQGGPAHQGGAPSWDRGPPGRTILVHEDGATRHLFPEASRCGEAA
jgi:hypothetical protein